MSLTTVSLNAVSSDEAGSVAQFDKPRSVSMYAISDSVSSGALYLDVSADGINFAQATGTSLSGSNTQVLSTNHLCLFARARLVSMSGTSVTAIILASD